MNFEEHVHYKVQVYYNSRFHLTRARLYLAARIRVRVIGVCVVGQKNGRTRHLHGLL